MHGKKEVDGDGWLYIKPTNIDVAHKPATLVEIKSNRSAYASAPLFTSSPVKPYCCSTCGKSYRQISLLNLHRKRHTGEARYSCEECGKLFTTSGNLKRHQLVHSGEKPYHCKYCERTFSDPTAKMRHLEIHDTDKGHKCPQCDKKFNQVRERARGYKKWHETQW